MLRNFDGESVFALMIHSSDSVHDTLRNICYGGGGGHCVNLTHESSSRPLIHSTITFPKHKNFSRIHYDMSFSLTMNEASIAVPKNLAAKRAYTLIHGRRESHS